MAGIHTATHFIVPLCGFCYKLLSFQSLLVVHVLLSSAITPMDPLQNKHKMCRQGWTRMKGRFMVVLAVGCCRTTPPSSHMTCSSGETQTLGSAHSTMGDESYLGGELPEDPFERGPVVIVGGQPIGSGRGRIRKSYLTKKPLPPLPPGRAMSNDSLGPTNTCNRALLHTNHNEEGASGVSASVSDMSFHTCLSMDSDEDDRRWSSAAQKSDSTWSDSTLSESGRDNPQDRLRTSKSMPKLAAAEKERNVSAVQGDTYPSQRSNDYFTLGTQSSNDVIEGLSPLFMAAAQVAWGRRACEFSTRSRSLGCH